LNAVHSTAGQWTDLFIMRGPPEFIRSDNGAEFIAKKVRTWIGAVGGKTAFITPGSPWENAYCESFKTIKAELIWRHPWEIRWKAEIAIFGYINGFYNPRRRHSGLSWKSPGAFERNVA